MPPKGVSKAVNKKCRECKKQVRERHFFWVPGIYFALFSSISAPYSLLLCFSSFFWASLGKGKGRRKVSEGKKGGRFLREEIFFFFLFEAIVFWDEVTEEGDREDEKKGYFSPPLSPDASYQLHLLGIDLICEVWASEKEAAGFLKEWRVGGREIWSHFCVPFFHFVWALGEERGGRNREIML